MAEQEVQNQLINTYLKKFPLEASRVLSSFSDGKILEYLNNQSAEISAAILSKMTPDNAADMLEAVEPKKFRELIEEVDVFLAARLISRFKPDNIPQRLGLLSSGKNRQIRELISYPSECAAFMMDARVTTFKPHTTVKEALKRIRTLKDRRIYQVFIVDDEGRLTDVIPLQNIAVSDTKVPLMDLAEKPPVSINALAPREEVVQLIEEKKLINVPVVDINNHLLGVIRNDTLFDAAKTDVTESVQAIFGAGREERALSKVSFAVRKRLNQFYV